MTEIEDVDQIWRAGLATAADALGPAGDVRARVAARVRHRQRSRRAVSAGAVAALMATTVVAVAELHHDDGRVRVAIAPTTTTVPVIRAVVQVNDAPGGALTMEFPGRTVTGNPPTISLPSGVIRFVVHDVSPGHDLVIDGIPAFNIDLATAGETITKDVQLDPGVYDLHCAIPGHEDAGEKILLVVR
jgi:hypothetical protein